MTRHAFMYAFDAVTPDPVERACENPGRARRRNDLPQASFLALSSTAEFNDEANVRASGGIVRPDRRLPMRDGKFQRMWLFDYLAAGM